MWYLKSKLLKEDSELVFDLIGLGSVFQVLLDWGGLGEVSLFTSIIPKRSNQGIHASTSELAIEVD